jgi:hypothetical protein
VGTRRRPWSPYASFVEAWGSAEHTLRNAVLVDRYENKRKLLYHYWNTLKQLSKLTSESASGLRKLSDKFKENRFALMALNLAESLEDFMWFQLLLEKLDPDTRKLFGVGHTYTGTSRDSKIQTIGGLYRRSVSRFGFARKTSETCEYNQFVSSGKHDVESEIGFYSRLVTSKLCTGNWKARHLQMSGVYAENFATTV